MNYKRAPLFPENTDVSALAPPLPRIERLGAGGEPYRAGDTVGGKRGLIARA